MDCQASRSPLPRLTGRQPLGRSGLQVSPVCLLASPKTPEEVEALAAALSRGSLLPEEEESMVWLSSLAAAHGMFRGRPAAQAPG